MSYLLTVLMPVYNASEHLREAIESILNQTFTNFEFLIIDDASTDDSVSIIRSYDDPRIRFVQNEKNLGISKTLNKGIEISSTELIARMDADDISRSNRLQLQYDYFLAHPETVLLSTSIRFINNEGYSIRDFKCTHAYNCYLIHFVCSLFHPTIMYKRSVVLAYGGYMVPYSEDFDLWWRIIVAGNNRVGHIEDILVDYRRSDKSLSTVLRKEEYNISTRELLLRNMQFLAGEHFTLTNEEVDFFQHQFDSLLNTGDIHAIVRAFKKLKQVNKLIFEKPNVNYKSGDLKYYAESKMDFSFNFFYIKLPRKQALHLLFAVFPEKIFDRIRSFFQRSLKPKKEAFQTA